MGLFTGRSRPSTPRVPDLVPLGDPKAADTARQSAYIGLRRAPRSLLIHGRGAIADCFERGAAAAPVLRTTELVCPSWYLGGFPGCDEIIWSALSGPAGSALAVFCFADSDAEFIAAQLVDRFEGKRLHPPWHFDTGLAGAMVPAAFAEIFAVAEPVPLGALPGLGRLPAPAPPAPPAPSRVTASPATASPLGEDPPVHRRPAFSVDSAGGVTPPGPPSGMPPNPAPPPPNTGHTGRVRLQRGQSEELRDSGPRVSVTIGWRTRPGGVDMDLDASAIVVDGRGKAVSDEHFVFYNNLRSPDGAVVHSGAEHLGAAEDVIGVDLGALAPTVTGIVFAVSIYDSGTRGHTFDRVTDVYVRIADGDGRQLLRYDAPRAASEATTMVFGELYRVDGRWHFRALGRGYPGGLDSLVREYGISV
ncbi:TerD family protein [Nocardia bovistercoris]|uniref:TerD family protein n=1 Tax=Nocardia bovistercoris TaxID=2785916 RepID=A0A931IGH1_9NOCA|nr:TerD family protein [Nocardia bovistercoris]MBH0779597.1 TerD family protein [Nocardia bovistercoris]